MQQITNEFRKAAFMAYPDAQVQAQIVRSANGMIHGKVRAYHDTEVAIEWATGITYPAKYTDCQLILTRLEDISDEDAKAIWVECKFNLKFKNYKEGILSTFQSGAEPDMDGNDVVALSDALRKRNYLLPFGNTDLVAAGVAVLR